MYSLGFLITLCTPSHLPHPFCMSFYLTLCDSIAVLKFDKEYKLHRSSLHNVLHPSVTSFSSSFCYLLLCLNILLCTTTPYTLNICFSLGMTDQVSHPQAQFELLLYILVFTFLDRIRRYKIFWTNWQRIFPEFNPLLIHLLLNVAKQLYLVKILKGFCHIF